MTGSLGFIGRCCAVNVSGEGAAAGEPAGAGAGASGGAEEEALRVWGLWDHRGRRGWNG